MSSPRLKLLFTVELDDQTARIAAAQRLLVGARDLRYFKDRELHSEAYVAAILDAAKDTTP